MYMYMYAPTFMWTLNVFYSHSSLAIPSPPTLLPPSLPPLSPPSLPLRVMEAAEQGKPSRWEGESSGSEVDPDDLLTEEQKGM